MPSSRSDTRRPRGRLAAFPRDDGGALTTLFVVLLPVLLFAAGLAIDLTHTNTQRRYVQAQADLAAMSGAMHFASADSVRAAARATIAANARYPAHPTPDSQIVLGAAGHQGAFQPVADQTSLTGVDAVRVVVRSPVRMFVMRLFLDTSAMVIEREAIAAVPTAPRVSFALSNCLLNLRLLEPILRPLIDSQVDVLCSGRGIDTRLSVFPTLLDLAARADLLTPGGAPQTWGTILDAELPVSDVLEVLTGRPVPPSPHAIRLGEVLYLPADLREAAIGNPVPEIHLQAADLILASAEILGQRILNLEVGLGLGGLASAQAAVRISDPRKIVVGARPGDPQAVARTSQIELDISELNILNLFALKLRVIVANASAALSDQGAACSPDPAAEAAVFDPVDASLLDVQLALRVLTLPSGQEALGLQTDTIRNRETRRVGFTHQQIQTDPVARFGPTGQTVQDSLASSLRAGTAALLNQAEQAVRAQGNAIQCSGLLGCLIGGVLHTLKATLQAVANTLLVTTVNVANALGAEGTLTNAILSDLVGLHIARADLEVLEVICGGGRPRLVR